MANRKTYSISNVKQLIDLNGPSTNFDITFKVVSHNKEPFDILVVDQTTLDNNPNLQYKKADKGEISGSLKHDKNVYQNYFLILRADKPCNCDVEIIKKDLPKVPQPQQMNTQQPQIQPQLVNTHPPKEDGFNWMKILIVIAVVAIGGFTLYWLSKKKSSSNTEKSVPAVEQPSPIIMGKSGFKYYSPPSASVNYSNSASTSPSPSPPGDNPLLRRLKSLNLS